MTTLMPAVPLTLPSSHPPSPLSSSSNSSPPSPSQSLTSSSSSQLTIGTLVFVQSRTWPGINKHGGVGKITACHFAPPGQLESVNVAYVLGGTEKKVQVEYVSLHSFGDKGRQEEGVEGTKGRSRRSRRSQDTCETREKKKGEEKEMTRSGHKRKSPSNPQVQKEVKQVKKTNKSTKKQGKRSLSSKKETPTSSGSSNNNKPVSSLNSVEKPMSNVTLKTFSQASSSSSKKLLATKPKSKSNSSHSSSKPRSKPPTSSSSTATIQSYFQSKGPSQQKTPHTSKAKGVTLPPPPVTTAKKKKNPIAPAVTPGSSGKKLPPTSTSTTSSSCTSRTLHTDIDVADLLANTGGRAAGRGVVAPVSSQRHTASRNAPVSNLSAAGTNSKYTTSASTSSTSTIVKEGSLVEVFHTMADQATEYVEDLVGNEKSVRKNQLSSNSRQEVVASPSNSSTSSLSVACDSSRYNSFQRLVFRVLRDTGEDCMQINDLVNKVNSIRSPEEEKAFTNMESRMHLKEIENMNFIMVGDDDNVYRI